MSTTTAPQYVAAGMLAAGDQIFASFSGHEVRCTIRDIVRGSTGTRNISLCDCVTATGDHRMVPFGTEQRVLRVAVNEARAA